LQERSGIRRTWGELKSAKNSYALIPPFWQPMIKKGARLERVTDRESALDIIVTLVNKEAVTLAIQDELINQHLYLSVTSAGKTVNEELERLAKIYKAELAKIQDEMREAIAERDTEFQEALAAIIETNEREMLRIQRDQAGQGIVRPQCSATAVPPR
jgi:hypothetical protein